MARIALLDRFRKRPAEDAPEGAPPAPPRAKRVPPPGSLRRERRALVRTREERIRDLGGLMLEMFRRDHFLALLDQQVLLELIAVEGRLREIDELLEVSVAQRREGVGHRCTCGAPIQWGSHFCANCGRQVGEEPIVSCSNCGNALPADAQFCANCGTAVPAASDDGNGQDNAQTMYKQAEQSGDPWES
jgi:predicted nucleic acid-binding Zn ribbon protein